MMKLDMTVLVVEKTAHVVAALTQTSGAPEEPAIEALAGDAVPIRTKVGVVHVPSDELIAQKTSGEPSILVAPTKFEMWDEPQNLPADVANSAITSTEATVTVPSNVTEDTTSRFVISGPGDPRSGFF